MTAERSELAVGGTARWRAGPSAPTFCGTRRTREAGSRTWRKATRTVWCGCCCHFLALERLWEAFGVLISPSPPPRRAELVWRRRDCALKARAVASCCSAGCSSCAGFLGPAFTGPCTVTSSKPPREGPRSPSNWATCRATRAGCRARAVRAFEDRAGAGMAGGKVRGDCRGAPPSAAPGPVACARLLALLAAGAARAPVAGRRQADVRPAAESTRTGRRCRAPSHHQALALGLAAAACVLQVKSSTAAHAACTARVHSTRSLSRVTLLGCCTSGGGGRRVGQHPHLQLRQGAGKLRAQPTKLHLQ